MIDNACDVMLVQLSFPSVNAPAQGVPGHFSIRYDGITGDVIKGRGRPGVDVSVHLMSSTDEVTWRTGKCQLWTHLLSTQPSEEVPIIVAVSGEAEWRIEEGEDDKLIFYVDPCGLFTDVATPITYKTAENDKSVTEPLVVVLEAKAGSSPNAYMRPPPPLAPVTFDNGVSFPYNPWFAAMSYVVLLTLLLQVVFP
jgi:hypothetical protein